MFVKQGKAKRAVCAALVLSMMLSAVSYSAFAVSDSEGAGAVETASDLTTAEKAANTYSKYYDRHADAAKPMKEVTFYAKDYVSADGAKVGVVDCDGKAEVLEWSNLEGSVTWKFNVPETGIYHIRATYHTREGKNTTNDFELLINGETPFESATRISLNRIWDNEEIKKDDRGNDILPQQIDVPQWITAPIIDTDGLFNEPLFFYFEAGENEITLKGDKANIYFESFTLYNDEALPKYDDIKPSESEISATPTLEAKRYEAENAISKTSSTIQPTSDTSSYLTSPSDPAKKFYNTLGQGSWKKAGQAASWEIEVPADGYYKINLRVRQNQMKGFYSNRRVYIDGEVPCEELNQYKFMYDSDWYTTTLKTDDGEDMYFYLTSGKHTLTLEVVPGEIGETMRKLEDYISSINKYYREILMITGPDPDEYNDYYIMDQIPELRDEFQRIIDGLLGEKSKLEQLTKSSGTEATTLAETATVLKKCLEKPRRIPMMLGTIKDNISTLSSWMSDYRDQPLELDYLEIASPDAGVTSNKKNFFKSMGFGIQSFWQSFFTDYTTLSDDKEGALTVWVAVGRDQAQVVKELVDSYFVPQYNVDVTINLVTTGITEAVLSGKGPDIALFCGGDQPIQLGSRGKLVDLTQFPDYKEVMTRFADDIATLYTYNDSVYALPVQQTFPVLFYRKDLLEEVGYSEPPETWDDFIQIVRTMQKNYMQAGLILPQVNATYGTYSATTESGHTFATLLLQRGLNYYNDTLTATQFDNIKATSAFEMWTDFYTVYDFDQQFDAYTRFRTGEMPMVVNNYSFYNQLYVAAPEIRGLWDFCKVPGTVREDGTISHATNSSGSGAMIFANKKKLSDEEYEKYKQNAWEFIKWFTSADIQTLYGNNLEGIMGIMGRFDTANKEALANLSWSTAEVAKLREQQDELVEIPVIPASYTVTRNIMNAFRAVVNEGENPRDSLITYNRDINNEITRKNEELGIALQ